MAFERKETLFSFKESQVQLSATFSRSYVLATKICWVKDTQGRQEGLPGSIWGHRVLSYPGRGCHRHLVGPGQACGSTSYNTQGRPHREEPPDPKRRDRLCWESWDRNQLNKLVAPLPHEPLGPKCNTPPLKLQEREQTSFTHYSEPESRLSPALRAFFDECDHLQKTVTFLQGPYFPLPSFKLLGS